MTERTRQLEYSELQPEMHNEPGRRTKAAKILAVLEHFRGTGDLSRTRVLDIGCSTGYIADELHRAGATTSGIDIDVPGLIAANARFGAEIGFLCGAGEDLPFPDSSIDIVVFNHIYEHVVDADAVVAEIHRILAPDGLAYFGLGNRWGIVEPHYGLPFLSWLPPRLADRYMRRFGRGDAYHERFRGRRELRQMTRAFDVWDYTDTVLAHPDRFAASEIVPGPLSRVPPVVWRMARPLMPTFIWIGSKAPSRPAGPTLGTSPRQVPKP